MIWLSYIAPFVGAIALEALTWWQLKDKLDQQKYHRLLRSPAYWIITVAWIVVGGFVCLILFATKFNPAELLVAGAALPTLLKKIIGAFVSQNGSTVLGANPTDRGVLYDYFNVAS